MSRLPISFVVLTTVLHAPVAMGQDETLEACRGLGIETLLQSFVLKESQQLYTRNLTVFCDDYGALKRDSEDLRKIIEEQSELIEQTSTDLADAESSIETLQGQVAQVGAALEAASKRLPPDGSILLVDNPAKCGPGWVDMAEAEPSFFAGRAILAVGSGYEYRDRGGAETHQLTVEEMPAHEHSAGRFTQLGTATGNIRLDIPSAAQAGLSSGWYGVESSSKPTNQAGENVPHNNMPPYVALYFCKRETG